MISSRGQWGVELLGSDEDQKTWRLLLKPPFDPFVEEVKDDRGDYLVLRSSAFDGIASAGQVHQAAKAVFLTLNVVMSKTADADPIRTGPVVEFASDGPPRKHVRIELEAGTYRIRAPPRYRCAIRRAT